MKKCNCSLQHNLSLNRKTDGCSHSSTGTSPSRGSRATLPIACDASPPELRLHARAVAVRESHYPVCASSPADRQTCFTSSCFSLAPWGGPGAPSVWLVTNRSYPSALCRPGIIRPAFLSRGFGIPRGKGDSRVPPAL